MGGDENLPRGEQSRWLEMGKSGYVIDAGLQVLLKDWMAGDRDREMDRGGERRQRERGGRGKEDRAVRRLAWKLKAAGCPFPALDRPVVGGGPV